MDLLKGLNTQQQQAVTADNGPVLVLAGPGSGKTRVLTHRIAYLISQTGVRPANMLAVTFTNKAAREMESRVNNLIGANLDNLVLGTFHATCARFLRTESNDLPFDSNFVIFDSDDQVNLVKRILSEQNIDDKRFRPTAVHNAISNAKNELRFPQDFEINDYRDEVSKQVYSRYQGLLLENNALDFDDLLLWTAFLLEEYPLIREKYARRFEHVLVDEFQDTNLAQYLLLTHFSSFHKNLYVVGDPDQSIYRWRGADYRNILRFHKNFPDARVILLEQNYRSTQSILDLAMEVINQHPDRTPKNLFTEKVTGTLPQVQEVFNDREEAKLVLEIIASLVNRAQFDPGDFAIMYRTNAQSRLLEESFLEAGLPYKLVGAQRFYGRREIKDIVAYLRLIHNPRDEISLMRVINTPRRGIGDKSWTALRTAALEQQMHPGELIIHLAGKSLDEISIFLTGRAAKSLFNFSILLNSWIAFRDELTPLQLVDRILNDVDYRSYIDDGSEQGNSRWENVSELRRLAADFSESNLSSFLERIALVSDQDTIQNDLNVPTLLTLHSAKGLEFPVVIIVGLSEGTLPHSRSLDDPEEILEECRLLYVGITRAQDRLFLIFPQNRTYFGYMEPVEPSRFLEKIPLDLVECNSTTLRTRSSIYSFGTNAKFSQQVENIEIEQQFHPGSKVIHPSWGEGMVLNSRLESDDEIVDIFFEDLGLKRVSASLANMEILPE